ncbi:hypothetical protein MCEMSEM23_00229 [Rhabdaerophilaceae bacterium]
MPNRTARKLATGIFLLTAAPVFAQSITPVPRPPVQGGAAGQASATPHTPVVTKSEATRKGRTEQDVFLGVYLSLDRECKIGDAPKFEFTLNPLKGKIRTRSHPINLRDVPGAPRRTCIGTSPSGQAVIYRSDRRFKGEETVGFRVIYPNGDVREVSVALTIE